MDLVILLTKPTHGHSYNHNLLGRCNENTIKSPSIDNNQANPVLTSHLQQGLCLYPPAGFKKTCETKWCSYVAALLLTDRYSRQHICCCSALSARPDVASTFGGVKQTQQMVLTICPRLHQELVPQSLLILEWNGEFLWGHATCYVTKLQ